MPEDKNCKLLQPPSSGDKKKKKKKKRRKKPSASTSPPENTDNPASLPPETPLVSLLAPQSPGRPRGQLSKLRAAGKKDGERLAGRSTKHRKDPPSPLTVTNKTGGGGGGVTAQGNVAELCTQARDSLRWEGALEDPRAEEKRMELYRANRRQRYISYREALLKESQCALRQTFPKEGK